MIAVEINTKYFIRGSKRTSEKVCLTRIKIFIFPIVNINISLYTSPKYVFYFIINKVCIGKNKVSVDVQASAASAALHDHVLVVF